MGAHDSVKNNVSAIFRELAGARASALLGNIPARQANDVLGLALSQDADPLTADEMAFQAFLVAFLLFPERFSAEELRAAVSMFLVHVPAHVLAAARLGGYEAKDIFVDTPAT